MKPTGLICCVLILVMFAFSMAEGAEWEYVTIDEEGNKRYIDSESIVRPSKDIARALMKKVYSDEGRDGMVKRHGSKYSALKEYTSLEEFNCTTKEFRAISITAHDSQGVAINSQTDKNREWKPIPPESVGEAKYKAVCAKKGKK